MWQVANLEIFVTISGVWYIFPVKGSESIRKNSKNIFILLFSLARVDSWIRFSLRKGSYGQKFSYKLWKGESHHLLQFCNNTSPPDINNVFKPAGQPNTTIIPSLLKLVKSLPKSNHGQRSISCMHRLSGVIYQICQKQQRTLTLIKTELRNFFIEYITKQAI